MRRVPGMRILGEAEERDAVISFLVGGIHHLDMGTLLDRLGIAVRTGHHCAEPLMRRLGVEGTVRASFGLYNTRSEVDALAEGIERVAKIPYFVIHPCPEDRLQCQVFGARMV
jgi:cysteine desulfurase/selenocysteine lyase